MGNPMCKQLVAAGLKVIVFDLNSAAMEELVRFGAHHAESGIDCAARSTILMTSLPRPSHVESVMVGGGALSALKPGSIWVDLTTNDPKLVRSLASQAPEGVGVVDAPVTGAVDGARNGKLTLFAGGIDTDLDIVVPVLEHLGLVIRCGDLGTGNVTKLVTNQLWFVAAAAIGEGFAMGVANGVNLETLWYAIKESVGDSFVARHDAPSIFAGHYDPSFTLDLCLKDLRLLQGLAENVGSDLPMTEKAHETFQRAADRFGSDVGELHVAKRIEDDANLSFRLEGDWVAPWDQ